jgi:hypothetical protein
MFIGLAAGSLSTAAIAQDPVLIIKIRNIDQLISDMERLVPQTPESQAAQQIGMLRMMLQGTDWIDPERSIVAGMVFEGQAPSGAAMIPFSVPNDAFQKNFNAIAGADYYMLPLPPQPGASVSPAVEQSLIDASRESSAINLVIEMAAGKLLDMLEPQMAAISQKIQAAPPEQMKESGMTPEQIQAVINATMEKARQVDILRFGLDLSGDIFTLHIDVDALPNTMLAGILVDQGGNARLGTYEFNMPMEFRSKPYDMSGMMDLLESIYGPVYGQLGIDIADMKEVVKPFTGEMAGGMSISSDGFIIEMIGTLQPGVDAADYVKNTYMPWFDRYNEQISNLVAKESGKPGLPLYERTADSTVAGITAMGVKTNFAALTPPDKQEDNPFADMAFEMRIAGADNLIFFASNDAKLESLITRSRNVAAAPAQGPTMSFDMDLGAFLKDIQSLIPPEKITAPFPVDLGSISMQADVKDGKLATRTSFNIAEMQKLAAFFAAAASKAKAEAGGAAPNPNVN